ncbi:hypothetical protein F442_21560 [Phytophthora nicotianae P10297]|uniref:Uncharacterized protein n=1 Tax=Phytophthora nicotianae P10297 TaxID=1317064 RepID=W2Y524_PHYNI|nr:hypothetical protein F442_21560 [Phytophthora nicotianae P10297]
MSETQQHQEVPPTLAATDASSTTPPGPAPPQTSPVPPTGAVPATSGVCDTSQMLTSLVSLFSLQHQAIATSQQQMHAFMAQQTRFQQEMYEMQSRANHHKSEEAAYTAEQNSNDFRFVNMIVPFLGIDVMAWYRKHAFRSLTKMHDLQVKTTQQEYSTKFLQLLSMKSTNMPEIVKR